MTEAQSGIPNQEYVENLYTEDTSEVDAVTPDDSNNQSRTALGSVSMTAFHEDEYRPVQPEAKKALSPAEVNFIKEVNHYLERFDSLQQNRGAGVRLLSDLSLMIAGNLHFNAGREFSLEQLRTMIEANIRNSWHISDQELANAYTELMVKKEIVPVLDRLIARKSSKPGENPSFETVFLCSVPHVTTNKAT